MFNKLYSLGLNGLHAFLVEVEVDISQGMPLFDVVGLPDMAIKESRNRIRSAIKNCGWEFPNAKVTINLAPADLKKAGSIYDLPMLIALLTATGQLEAGIASSAFIGEVSLNGDVRPAAGVLPMVLEAKKKGITNVFVPKENAKEGSYADGIHVFGISHVEELVRFLAGVSSLTPEKHAVPITRTDLSVPDFEDIKGQAMPRRALEIAAAGGHNALLIGSPGSGKSMLAKRLPSILPDMSFDETIDTTKIYSIAGLLTTENPMITRRPFRSPHHSISPSGLAGGGTIPRPGEISLAHNGVLFLDELPEFQRNSLEVLRQPLEDGLVTISRVSGTLSYPCSIMLIAAMNPCPCGFFGHPTRRCTCNSNRISQYLGRISGPLLDRIDLHIDALPVEFEEMHSDAKGESSAAIRSRVNAARALQEERNKGSESPFNARLSSAQTQELNAHLTEAASNIFRSAFEKLGLSARAYDRILKTARTIADLDKSETIESAHIGESIQYRSLDRKYWSRQG